MFPTQIIPKVSPLFCGKRLILLTHCNDYKLLIVQYKQLNVWQAVLAEFSCIF